VARRSCSLVVVAAGLIAADARADDEPITPRIELRHDLRIDLPATAVLTAVVVGWRLTRDDLEPSTCRWCDGNAPGQVNAVDDWFRKALVRRDTQPANVTSYALAFGAAPVSGAVMSILAAVADRRGDEALVNVVIVAEGGLSAMLVTEILEPIVLRTRPYVHAIADDDERARVIAQTGAFHSFPAGHVVEAFGVATSAGVVASMRGYRLAPLVWLSGMMIGAATAYTRMAADRHYFTDTLAGAVIGSAVGATVPLVFHGRKSGVVPMAMPMPGGGVVGVGGAF
jgi:membrane-associated phospholipid phosphatase